jgi:DNA-binding transcriptional LysR family regulator
VRSARLEPLTHLLESGVIGLPLLWHYEWNGLEASDVRLPHLFDDPTMLVVGADHRLARRRHVAMSDLPETEWIVQADNHPVADVLERACRAAGHQPRICFHANDHQEAQAMVGAGLGSALSPLTAVVSKPPDVRLVSSATPPVQVHPRREQTRPGPRCCGGRHAPGAPEVARPTGAASPRPARGEVGRCGALDGACTAALACR